MELSSQHRSGLAERSPETTEAAGSAAASTAEDDRVRRVLAGDKRAFEELLGGCRSRIHACLARTTGSGEEADDILQEASLQAYLKLAGFRRGSAFGTWLYAIAFNIARVRRRRRQTWLSLDAVSDLATRRTAVQTPSDSERAEDVRRVREALDSLPADVRRILQLREFDGYTYETIAEVLQVPVGTVRSRIHRARLRLKSQLEEKP